MLFDHGCDSIITGVFIITWMKLLASGVSFQAYMILVGGMTGFYLSTLESYYLGGLFLPIINVPSDGNVFLVGLAAVGAMFDSNDWMGWDVPMVNEYLGIDWMTWRDALQMAAPALAFAGIGLKYFIIGSKIFIVWSS
jgi:hypothetical protein